MSTNEAIMRLETAVTALADVDVSVWPETALRSHLDELSRVLCQVDAELSRVAEAVRARGFRVEESYVGASS
ncbi:MAG TPA: hypothetical protein VF054_13785 [Micromonosporaceae bacterium]